MIIRHTPTRWTTLPKGPLEDGNLSLRARGLLATLAAKPDDWRISSAALAREVKEGRDAVRKAFSELVEAGYACTVRYQNPDSGQWGTVVVLDLDGRAADFDLSAQPVGNPVGNGCEQGGTGAWKSVSGATSANAAKSQVSPETGLPAYGAPGPFKSTQTEEGGSKEHTAAAAAVLREQHSDECSVCDGTLWVAGDEGGVVACTEPVHARRAMEARRAG